MNGYYVVPHGTRLLIPKIVKVRAVDVTSGWVASHITSRETCDVQRDGNKEFSHHKCVDHDVLLNWKD